MKFHVLTPVLNGAQFLGDALDSIRAQNWNDWRITVLDAGSQDGSAEIAASRARTDRRIELQIADDAGQFDALRRGFDGAPGEVFCWLNADDMLTPWAFETVAEHFQRGQRWVTGQPAHWDSQGRLVAVSPIGFAARLFIAKGWRHDSLMGCVQQESTFFSAELWHELSAEERHRFATLKLAGDFYLWKLFARQERLDVASSVLGGFRVHGANRSRLLADAYINEVRECGGFIPPAWIARPIRELHDHINALSALHKFRNAAALLHQGLAPR